MSFEVSLDQGLLGQGDTRSSQLDSLGMKMPPIWATQFYELFRYNNTY